jgi:hypothetical protein
MKIKLAIPYDRVNSKGHYMDKDIVLHMLYKRGFVDSNIIVDEEVKIIYVHVEVLDIKDDGVIVFETDADEEDGSFPLAPSERGYSIDSKWSRS